MSERVREREREDHSVPPLPPKKRQRRGRLLMLTSSYLGGCGQSFQAMIVSPLFEKKNSLARHRLVNSALKAEIAAIHAWTPKCFTPEEWEKKQSQ